MAKKKLSPDEISARIIGLESYLGIVFDDRDEDYPTYVDEEYGTMRSIEDRLKKVEDKKKKKSLFR